MALLEQVPTAPSRVRTGAPPGEQGARRTLRRQIARLEAELGAAVVAAYPARLEPPAPARPAGGPRLLPLGALERVRDELADRVAAARGDLAHRAEAQEQARLLLERMLLEPARHKWVRVSREDLGLPGCGHWHVRPRLGIVGMMMGWWQVKVSSGCPLSRGPGWSRGPRAVA